MCCQVKYCRPNPTFAGGGCDDQWGGDRKLGRFGDERDLFLSKMFQINFVGNPGDLADLKVAYSFVESRDGEEYVQTNTACGGTKIATNSSNMDRSGSLDTDLRWGLTNNCGPSAITATKHQYHGELAAAWVDAYVDGAFEAVAADNLYLDSITKDGTTESAECSSRGLCDYTTGRCKCFRGFGNADCSRRNALDMV